MQGHPRHRRATRIEDLNVTTQLRGDFEACHTEGDNSQVRRDRHPEEHRLRLRPRDGVGSPEEFLLTARPALRGEFRG